MSGNRVDVFGGVDTHRDTHVAAVVDTAGRLLGSESFAAEGAGYQRLVAWLGSQGHLVRVGVEGTGSYGAGLARYLTEADIEVVEVNRPNRQLRRQKGGKTDSVDAEAAARSAASGQATAVPKSGDGPVECLRMLRTARRSAVKARTQAANQIHSLVVTGPEQVKQQLKGMNLKAQVRVCARFRPGTDHTTTAYAKRALRHLARRYQTLDTEIGELDTEIRGLCAKANPALLAAEGVGPDTAAALLVAVGDNPGRMKSERSSASPADAPTSSWPSPAQNPNPLPTTPDPTRNPRKPTPSGLTTRQGHPPGRTTIPWAVTIPPCLLSGDIDPVSDRLLVGNSRTARGRSGVGHRASGPTRPMGRSRRVGEPRSRSPGGL